MKNKIGFTLFAIGFFGTLLMGMGLDSPGDAWKGCMIMMIIFFLIGVIGYKTMNVNEVLRETTGYVKERESRAIRERKARNREQVWQTWLATERNTL